MTEPLANDNTPDDRHRFINCYHAGILGWRYICACGNTYDPEVEGRTCPKAASDATP